MKFTDKEFRGAEVYIDGNQYTGCEFHDCRIVYSGGRTPSFDSCGFDSCRFELEGAAGNTLAFIKAMAHPSSGMQDLVVATLPEIFSIQVDKK